MANSFKEKWDRKDMLSYLDEFNELYDRRPIKENGGGMKSPHMFPSWYVVKKMQPSLLIESGVWKGLGTWFFEQASPNTKIISIDPSPHFRVYTSPNATYQTEDFLQTDWSNFDKINSLVFFDDHQNSFERIKRCQSLGFNKLMVEDNYPWQQGDCYTPKKILSGKDFIIDKDGERLLFRSNYDVLAYFQKNVSVYQEMPPIFVDKYTRWGDLWNEDYPTPEPLISHSESTKYPVFFNEKKDYTWICYIELYGSAS
jgi:hypothetical protein